MKKPDFSKHGPHVAMMMANEGWTDADISVDRKPIINMAKKLYDIGKRIEDTLHKEKVPGKIWFDAVDTKKQAVIFLITGDEIRTHDKADEVVQKEFGPENIVAKVSDWDYRTATHTYLIRRALTKANELPGKDDVDELEVLEDD